MHYSYKEKAHLTHVLPQVTEAATYMSPQHPYASSVFLRLINKPRTLAAVFSQSAICSLWVSPQLWCRVTQPGCWILPKLHPSGTRLLLSPITSLLSLAVLVLWPERSEVYETQATEETSDWGKQTDGLREERQPSTVLTASDFCQR